MALRWLLVLAAFGLAAPAGAQEEKVRTVPFEGPEFFAHILFHEELKPIRKLQDAEDDAANSIVIIFGNPRLFQADPLAGQRLKRFVDQGGNLLIATDYGMFINELTLGTSGSRVTQRNEHEAYRGDERCPWVSHGNEYRPGEQPTNDHPLFHFLSKKIATNCPSFVSNWKPSPSRRALLTFPETAVADVAQILVPLPAVKGKGKAGGKAPRGLETKPPSPLPYMIGSPGAAPPNGRVLLIAGHGMFMNGMMVQRDNDNFDFAVNAVRWLRESSAGQKRSRALFVVDSEVATNFDMKFSGAPLPVPTVEHLNRLLRGLEEERFFQKVISDLFGVYLGRFVAILAALATFGLLIYGTKKFLEGRAHVDTAVPSMVGLLPARNPAGPMQERSHARLRKTNYVAECRQLARDWLHAEFQVAPDRWQAAGQAELAVRGGWWSARRLRRQGAFVLRLARAADAAQATRHEFFLLAEALRDLTAARHQGRLALRLGADVLD